MLFVAVSYIAAIKCATYEVNIIFRSRRSINIEGKDCISDVRYDLAGIDGLFGCMDNSCKQRVYCLHCSFVIVHTEHGQWQASFTQEKLACLMEVSLTEQIIPPPTHKNLGMRLALG